MNSIILAPMPLWVIIVILTGVVVLVVLLLKVMSDRHDKEANRPKGVSYVPRPEGYKSSSETSKPPWEDNREGDQH